MIIMSNYNENNQFYHFTSIINCIKFMNSIQHIHYKLNTCCNGKGFSINIIYKVEIDKLYKIFIRNNEQKISTTYRKNYSELNCSVCYESCYTYPKCGHTLCKDCTEKGNLTKCPICLIVM